MARPGLLPCWLLLLAALVATSHAFFQLGGAGSPRPHTHSRRRLHMQRQPQRQQPPQQQQQQQDRRGALATGVKAGAVLGALGLGFGFKGPALPSFAQVPPVGGTGALASKV